MNHMIIVSLPDLLTLQRFTNHILDKLDILDCAIKYRPFESGYYEVIGLNIRGRSW